MAQYYIYKTTNLINGKQYIGKHKGEIDDDYLGSGILLTPAINKYGIENFKKEILYISQSEEENRQKEQYFIQYYHAVESDQFYNIADGGQGGFVTAGYTPQQRQAVNQKISEKLSKENHPMYGKKHTEETKEKIRQSVMQYWTPERRAERADQVRGDKNPMYGKKKTPESIAKQIAHTDYSYMRTPEYHAAMSKATSGVKNGNYGNKDEKAKNGKPVGMFDENNQLIRYFNTKQMALTFLNLKGKYGLNKAIKEHSLYKGYYWKEVPRQIQE